MLSKKAHPPKSSLWALILESSRSEFSQSLTIPIAFSLLQLITGFTFEDQPIYGISQHYLDVIASLTSLVCFQIARRIKSKQSLRVPISGFNLWIAAGILAVLVPQGLLTAIGGGLYPDQPLTILSGLVSYPLAMVAMGVTTSLRLSSRTKLAELVDQRNKMLALRDSLDDEIATYQSEMTSEVRNRLSGALHAIEASESNSPEDIVKTSQQLRNLIDVVIRPLSLELSNNQELSYKSDTESKTASGEPNSWESRIASVKFDVQFGQLVSPGLFATSAGATLIPAFYSIYGQKGAAVTLFSIACITGVLWAIRKLFGARRMNALLTALIMVGISSAVGFGASITGISLIETKLDPIETTLGFFTTSLVNEMFLYYTARLMHSISDAERVNTEIDQLLTRLKQEFWVTRKQLARLVHGKIQARLLAASMRISASRNPTDQDIRNARADILEAIHALEIGGQDLEESLSTQIQRLEEVWDGVCNLDLEISQEAREAIENDKVARSCLAEVLGEATANAAKHSRSSDVAINISLAEPGLIQVAIRTVGSFSANLMSKTGYGSIILNEVTTSWSLEGKGNEVTLHALIPAKRP